MQVFKKKITPFPSREAFRTIICSSFNKETGLSTWSCDSVSSCVISSYSKSRFALLPVAFQYNWGIFYFPSASQKSQRSKLNTIPVFAHHVKCTLNGLVFWCLSHLNTRLINVIASILKSILHPIQQLMAFGAKYFRKGTWLEAAEK